MGSASWPESGGGSGTELITDWRAALRAEAYALDETLVRMPVSSDLCNLSSDLTLHAETGTGSIAALQNTKGGATEFASGATAGGLRIANLGSSVGTATLGSAFTANSRTEHWLVHVKFKIVTAPAGTGRLPICCFQDKTNDNYVGILPATSTTNYVISIGGTPVDTGVPFDMNWHTLRLHNGTAVQAYLDGVALSTPISNSGIATDPGWSRTYAYNGDQNANTNFYLAEWALITGVP